MSVQFGLNRGDYAYRINAGSTLPILDDNDNVWQADAFFNAGVTFTAPASLAIDTSGPGTLAGAGAQLYRSERYFDIAEIDLVYRLPVAQAGYYNVELHFAEVCTCVTAPGQRLFNVKVRLRTRFEQATFGLSFQFAFHCFTSLLTHLRHQP
jgi:hypothetical protein